MIEFKQEVAEEVTRELIIGEIVELEKMIDFRYKLLDRDRADCEGDKHFDENLTSAARAVDIIKRDALKAALINNDFDL